MPGLAKDSTGNKSRYVRAPGAFLSGSVSSALYVAHGHALVADTRDGGFSSRSASMYLHAGAGGAAP